MIIYTLLYGALAVVEFKLLLTYIQPGAVPVEDPRTPPIGPTTNARLRLLSQGP
jgi:hypothetical protein